MSPLRPGIPGDGLRAELRTLHRGQSLVSTRMGRHFTVGLDTWTLARILRAWDEPAEREGLPEGWDRASRALHEAVDGDDRAWRTLLRTHADPATEQSRNGTAATRAAASGVPGPQPGARLSEATGFLLAGDPQLAAELGSGLADLGIGTAYHEGSHVHAGYRAFREHLPLLWCAVEPDAALFTDIDRFLGDLRVEWICVEARFHTLVVGPRARAGSWAGYEDFAGREHAAAGDPRLHRALRAPASLGAAPQAARAAVGQAAELIAAGLEPETVHVLVPGEPPRRHPVLPLPGSSIPDRMPHEPDDLVSPLCGLITRTRHISHHPRVPAALTTVQSDVADLRRISPWSNTTTCQGSGFAPPEDIAPAAVGEAVERYAANVLDTLPLRFGSHRSLARGPVRVLDPESLVLFSERQYAAPGFPFAPFTRETEVHWVPSTSLSTGEEVLVPASMVYVNWFIGAYAHAPHTNFCAFAGVAAGPDYDFAVMSALEEIVERHITMAWWLNAHPLPLADTAGLLERIGPHEGQEFSVISLPNEFGIPVAAGIVRDRQEQLVHIGFSARAAFADAALKAWTEALTLQEGARDLLLEDGAYWRAIRAGTLPGRSYKPWREDRRYLDDFRADMHDVDDLMVQQQVYLDPRAEERMSTLLRPQRTVAAGGFQELPARSLQAYLDRFHARGYEVLVADLTTPDIASTGMRVVRVIVPGTIGNSPAAFPYLGRQRVQQLAVELGWRDSPLPEDELNVFPMPHS